MRSTNALEIVAIATISNAHNPWAAVMPRLRGVVDF
jgi:hypothetical protein